MVLQHSAGKKADCHMTKMMKSHDQQLLSTTASPVWFVVCRWYRICRTNHIRGWKFDFFCLFKYTASVISDYNHSIWCKRLVFIVPDRMHSYRLSEISNRIAGKILQHTIWCHILFFFQCGVYKYYCSGLRGSLVWRRSTECQRCKDNELVSQHNGESWVTHGQQLSTTASWLT